jgi:hypothetical protein
MFSCSALLICTINLSLVQYGFGSLRDARLQMHLRQWEDSGLRIKDFQCEFEQKRIDCTFPKETLNFVSVAGTGPQLLRLDFRNAQHDLEYIFLIHNADIHLYDYAKKSELVGRWLLNEPSVPERSWFERWLSEIHEDLNQLALTLAGKPSLDLIRRFDFSLQSEDAYYVYLVARPRSEGARAFCDRIQLALDKKTYATSLLITVFANGDKISHTLKTRQPNTTPPLSAESLTKELPIGWKQLSTTTLLK